MGCVYTFKLGQNEHEEHMVRVKMNGQSRGVWNLSTRKENREDRSDAKSKAFRIRESRVRAPV